MKKHIKPLLILVAGLLAIILGAFIFKMRTDDKLTHVYMFAVSITCTYFIMKSLKSSKKEP